MKKHAEIHKALDDYEAAVQVIYCSRELLLRPIQCRLKEARDALESDNVLGCMKAFARAHYLVNPEAFK